MSLQTQNDRRHVKLNPPPQQYRNQKRESWVHLETVARHCGIHSLSSSEEERVGERRHHVGKLKSPLPSPLPARASRGEGAGVQPGRIALKSRSQTMATMVFDGGDFRAAKIPLPSAASGDGTTLQKSSVLPMPAPQAELLAARATPPTSDHCLPKK